jgi:hypothetical protein
MHVVDYARLISHHLHQLITNMANSSTSSKTKISTEAKAAMIAQRRLDEEWSQRLDTQLINEVHTHSSYDYIRMWHKHIQFIIYISLSSTHQPLNHRSMFNHYALCIVIV